MKSSSRLNRCRSYSRSRAFTLVELLVSIAIFAMMTALVVVKYGNFNQSVLLTNLAYDVAMTIRTAQTYGLSVKDPNESNQFIYAYGVTIGPNTKTCAGGATTNSQQFLMFADSVADNFCTENGADILVSTYAIKRGAVVESVCAGSGPGFGCSPDLSGRLHITFKRPEPRANICLNSSCDRAYAEIVLKSTDGNTRKVIVRSNGQITVAD